MLENCKNSRKRDQLLIPTDDDNSFSIFYFTKRRTRTRERIIYKADMVFSFEDRKLWSPRTT